MAWFADEVRSVMAVVVVMMMIMMMIMKIRVYT